MYYKEPTRTLNSINNRVTVSLPMTTIDAEEVSKRIQLENLRDVDVKTYGKEDGSVLVFDEYTQMWKSQRLLNKQIIDAGEY
jgi:hypothetical protein